MTKRVLLVDDSSTMRSFVAATLEGEGSYEVTQVPSGFAALPPTAGDLVLSGHTHGGHIGVQLGRSRALTVVGLLGLPDQGLFARGDMRLFVTRCVGFYGYPMRVGIPPEIAVLVLRTPESSSDPAPVRAL